MSGLIEQIEDFHIFVEGFGPDMLSDMTTNIIKKCLIKFTLYQAHLYGMGVEENRPTGTWWNVETSSWAYGLDKMLVVDDQPIVLVPKWWVTFNSQYTPSTFYEKFMVEFIRSEQLRIRGALVTVLKGGKNEVYKKDVKEKHPFSKDNVADFALTHKGVFDKFKQTIKSEILHSQSTLEEHTTGSSDPQDLVAKLKSIPVGKEYAVDYQRCVLSIFNYLFVDQLIDGALEEKVYSDTKRLDILHTNVSTRGFFDWLPKNTSFTCPFVLTECKNYSSDISNPEIDQLSGRLSHNIKFGMIAFRRVENYDNLITRIKVVFNNKGYLILPISDDLLINALSAVDPLKQANAELIKLTRNIILG